MTLALNKLVNLFSIHLLFYNCTMEKKENMRLWNLLIINIGGFCPSDISIGRGEQ